MLDGCHTTFELTIPSTGTQLQTRDSGGTLHSFGISASTVEAYLVAGLCQ